jgi:hypothetical protein
MEAGLAATMTYGDGSSNTIQHYYSGKVKQKKSKMKKSKMNMKENNGR